MAGMRYAVISLKIIQTQCSDPDASKYLERWEGIMLYLNAVELC